MQNIRRTEFRPSPSWLPFKDRTTGIFSLFLQKQRQRPKTKREDEEQRLGTPDDELTGAVTGKARRFSATASAPAANSGHSSDPCAVTAPPPPAGRRVAGPAEEDHASGLVRASRVPSIKVGHIPLAGARKSRHMPRLDRARPTSGLACSAVSKTATMAAAQACVG